MFKKLSWRSRKAKVAIAASLASLSLLTLMLAVTMPTLAAGRGQRVALLSNSVNYQANLSNVSNRQGMADKQDGTTATNASVTFKQTPPDVAFLTYDPTAKRLLVTVLLYGLIANSKHNLHIHKGGTCQTIQNQPVAFDLNDVTADGSGFAVSQNTIPDVANGIPDNTWFITLHGSNGENAPIACGTIRNPGKALFVQTKLTRRTASDTGADTSTKNTKASGKATLTLNQNKQLKVHLTLQGLVPNTSHAAHIHAGSCDQAGGVLYHLDMQTPIRVNGDGEVDQTITIPVHEDAIPANSWAINIHSGTKLTDQKQYTPLLCGTVVPTTNTAE